MTKELELELKENIKNFLLSSVNMTNEEIFPILKEVINEDTNIPEEEKEYYYNEQVKILTKIRENK